VIHGAGRKKGLAMGNVEIAELRRAAREIGRWVRAQRRARNARFEGRWARIRAEFLGD